MVTTKLVEWAGKVIEKVVYITGREVDTERARFKVYKVESVEVMGDIHIGELKELLIFQCVKDKGVQEYVARIATNMVYIPRMKERLISQYREDTREVNFIMIEDTNMEIVVNFKSMEVRFMVYIMQMEDRLIYLYEKYENIIMIEVYVMQMRKAVSFKFVEVVRTDIVEVVRTAILEMVRTIINKEERLIYL